MDREHEMHLLRVKLKIDDFDFSKSGDIAEARDYLDHLDNNLDLARDRLIELLDASKED
jgi:hypothetical protein